MELVPTQEEVQFMSRMVELPCAPPVPPSPVVPPAVHVGEDEDIEMPDILVQDAISTDDVVRSTHVGSPHALPGVSIAEKEKLRGKR